MQRVCGVVALLSIVSGAAAVAAADVHASGPTIEVVANATVAVKPDQAELDVGVTTDKRTATAAVSETEHKMEQVLAALKKEVGSNGEIKTSEVSVEPRFEETREGRVTSRVAGYTATNRVLVRIANVGAVGRLLDLAFKAGANTVERVRFTLKDPDAAQSQALRAASAKARGRATAMADGQGLRVGDVITVREGAGMSYDKFGYEGLARNANIVPSVIEPGSVEVSATVTVIFALKPR